MPKYAKLENRQDREKENEKKEKAIMPEIRSSRTEQNREMGGDMRKVQAGREPMVSRDVHRTRDSLSDWGADR